MTNIKIGKELDSWLAFLQSIGAKPQGKFMQLSESQLSYNGETKLVLHNALNKLNELVNSTEWKQFLDKGNKQQSARLRREAEELGHIRDDVLNIEDPYKYGKFDKLGDFGLSNQGLVGVYRVAEDIRKDIGVARDWIKSYKKFASELKMFPPSLDITKDELRVLGQSILGRAIELTPMDTGYLRKSATLLVFNDHIRIRYTAPYSSYIHDNLEISHPVHPHNPNCGGRAKFLEIALQEFFPDRTSWKEVTGNGEIEAIIGINPLYVEYLHYN